MQRAVAEFVWQGCLLFRGSLEVRAVVVVRVKI